MTPEQALDELEQLACAAESTAGKARIHELAATVRAAHPEPQADQVPRDDILKLLHSRWGIESQEYYHLLVAVGGNAELRKTIANVHIFPVMERVATWIGFGQ